MTRLNPFFSQEITWNNVGLTIHIKKKTWVHFISFYAIQTSLILLLGLDPWPLDPLDPPKPQESHPNNRIKENWSPNFCTGQIISWHAAFSVSESQNFWRTAAVVMRRDVLSGTVSVGPVFFRLKMIQFFSSHTIHGTICKLTDPWMVDFFYGFHVGRYTSLMDGMGFVFW